ncbi:hypothetical protein IH992_27130 [Candidatus Poribacteria bacterium]|nr:hypothetical protein [Candidatus Poribacteria bacterium]
MNGKQFGLGYILVICVSLSGCLIAENLSGLSNQWSENFALSPYGTVANHPSLNDGNLETVGVIHPVDGERVLTLKFERIKQVHKIVIHNDNLFRFNVDYLDAKTQEWKTIHEVRQRRNIGKERTNTKYVIDRLNFKTDTIRINVLRTVDDRVVSRATIGEHDRVVNRVRGRLGGRYVEEFHILSPSMASVREIEVYHLVKK